MLAESQWSRLCEECAVPWEIFEALLERGYKTNALVTYSITTNKAMDNLIWELLLGVDCLRPDLTDDSLDVSPEAGSLRRIWHEGWK